MKRTNGRWIVVFLLFLATTINYTDRAILGISGPAIMKDLSLTTVQFGLLGSAFFWSYALMQVPVGMIVDKLGAKLSYSIAIVWWSLATVFTGMGRSLGMLIGIRFLMGMGEAPAFPTNTRVISDWLPSKERGMANGLFNSGTAIGTGLTTPLLAWIITGWGWHMGFYTVGALGFVWLIFWLIFYKNKPQDAAITNKAETDYIAAELAKDGKAEEVKINPFAFFKYRNAYPLLYGLFAHNYLQYLLMTWLPTYLVVQRHMTLVKAGFFTMLPWIMAFLGNILGGIISDLLIRRGWNRIKARKTTLALGMLFPFALIPTFYVASPLSAVLLISLAIGGEGIAAGILWATVADVAPKGAEGKLAGLQNFIGNLAGWLAPVVTGVLVATFHNFTIALIIPVIICTIASILYMFGIKNERISLKKENNIIDSNVSSGL